MIFYVRVKFSLILVFVQRRRGATYRFLFAFPRITSLSLNFFTSTSSKSFGQLIIKVYKYFPLHNFSKYLVEIRLT